MAPLSAAREMVPEELYDSVSLFVSGETPGFLTPGQTFAGRLTESDWAALQGAEVRIAHNSWYTADALTLVTDPEVTATPLVGLAWGTFDLARGDEDFFQGSYALLIGGPLGGSLVLDPTCQASPALGAALRELAGRELAARAAIVKLTDRGDFTAGPSPARGAYRNIGKEGRAEVTAEGCLGAEVARFTVSSVREGG